MVWPNFRPKSGSKSKIPGRILKIFRGPVSSAELGAPDPHPGPAYTRDQVHPDPRPRNTRFQGAGFHEFDDLDGDSGDDVDDDGDDHDDDLDDRRRRRFAAGSDDIDDDCNESRRKRSRCMQAADEAAAAPAHRLQVDRLL